MEASITTYIFTLEKKSLLKAYLTEQLPPLMPPPTTSATVMVKKYQSTLHKVMVVVSHYWWAIKDEISICLIGAQF